MSPNPTSILNLRKESSSIGGGKISIKRTKRFNKTIDNHSLIPTRIATKPKHHKSKVRSRKKWSLRASIIQNILSWPVLKGFIKTSKYSTVTAGEVTGFCSSGTAFVLKTTSMTASRLEFGRKKSPRRQAVSYTQSFWHKNNTPKGYRWGMEGITFTCWRTSLDWKTKESITSS